MTKIYYKECKFFILWNHKPHCVWQAILSPSNPPEDLKDGCKDNCVWKSLTNEQKSDKIYK